MTDERTNNASAADGRWFVKMIRTGTLLAVHTLYDHPDPEPFVVPSFGMGEAYMTAIYLRPIERAEVWRNGRSLGSFRGATGALQIFDLRQTWRALIHAPFETINIRVPRSMLIEAAGDGAELNFEPEAVSPARVDLSMLGLAQALRPAFYRPSELTAMFAEQIVLAVATHLVDVYRDIERPVSRPKEGLAPWQQRRAADLLMDQLDTDVALASIAGACGLSQGHFSRAFRISFGLPPHRWLLQERVRRASEIMRTTEQPLDEIAVACGFVDQSHLSRVFRKIMGSPPGAWRRAQRGGQFPVQGSIGISG